MAKKKRPTTPRPLTRKQRSRVERETRMSRWLIIGSVAIGILAVGVLIYGYLTEEVLRPREPAAVVNGVVISTADFQTRVRYRRYRLQWELDYLTGLRMNLDPTNPEDSSGLEQLAESIGELQSELSSEKALALGEETLNEMIQEELIRQEASRLGIEVSQEEVDQGVERWFGYSSDATAEEPALPATGAVTTTEAIASTSVITRGAFEKSYEGFTASILEPSGLGVKGFRALIEASLLIERVYEIIVEGVPTVADQVRLRYMTFPSEELANEVLLRLEGGEAWENVVAEIEASADSEEAEFTGVETGELDWRTEGFLVEYFGEESVRIIFETPVDGYTPPLFGLSGQYYKYHVIQVLGHEEQELEPLMLSYEKERAFWTWFDQKMQYVEYSESWREKIPTEP
jgi:parvulin-like peptidyl-prolyl isomerase